MELKRQKGLERGGNWEFPLKHALLTNSMECKQMPLLSIKTPLSPTSLGIVTDHPMVIPNGFQFQLGLILQPLQVDFNALPQSYSNSAECLQQPRAPLLHVQGFVNDDGVGLEWKVAE